ncbi:MAG: lipoyl synthase [Sulfobacillus sp.]
MAISPLPFEGAKPQWLKVRLPTGPEFFELKRLMREQGLHTVCEDAHCPNVGECWGNRTATFMILGNICTRACGFCAVHSGRPTELDLAEPRRVAAVTRTLGLEHVVVTSVARDDLADGGALVFALTIAEIRRLCPGTAVEVLTPDFAGNWQALALVVEAAPDILNHNLETVERLSDRVRSRAKYRRSLEFLSRAKQLAPTLLTKSGIMLGLGEERDEVEATLADMRAAGIDIVTIGQYLRPSLHHLPLIRYVAPEEFAEIKAVALGLGFGHVEAGPLVRSSYHAHTQVPARG